MLLQVNGAAGQQLFVCNATLDGWVMVNDDTTSTAADHTYTDQQVAAEASARTAADSAETSARQAADATLQSNIDAEATRAQSAETSITTNRNSEITRATGAEAAEATTRAAADAALGVFDRSRNWPRPGCRIDHHHQSERGSFTCDRCRSYQGRPGQARRSSTTPLR